MEGKTDGRMNKSPPMFDRTFFLWGRCPASPHSNSQSLKARQRVPLTIYCPWATCYPFQLVLSADGRTPSLLSSSQLPPYMLISLSLQVAGFLTCLIIVSAFALPVVLAHSSAHVFSWMAVGFTMAANVVVFINIALCVYLLIRRDF